MDEGSPDLRHQVANAMAWKLGSQIFTQVVRFAVILVLARLLTPLDYGRAAIALVVANFALVLTDIGFGAALVQARTIDEEDQSTIFWSSAAIGGAMAVAGVAASPLLAAAFGDSRAQPLIAAMSIAFFVGGLGTVHRALLSREMNFRLLEILLMISTAAGGGAAVAIAALGGGAWAVILQQIIGTSLYLILLWFACDWRPRPTFSKASLHKLGRFSSNVFGSRLISDVNQNVDNFLVARFLGPSALGIYALSYTTTLLPANRLSVPLQEVILPTFSRLPDDDEARIRHSWAALVGVVASIATPMLVALAVLAPLLVPLLFGERWTRATAVIQFLSVVGLAESLTRVNLSTVQARGHAGFAFRVTLATVAFNLIAFSIGLNWGVVGVAGMYALSMGIACPATLVLCARRLGGDSRLVLQVLLGPAVGAVVMAGALLGVELAGDAIGASDLAIIVVASCVGLPLYAIALRAVAQNQFREIVALLRSARAAA